MIPAVKGFAWLVVTNPVPAEPAFAHSLDDA